MNVVIHKQRNIPPHWKWGIVRHIPRDVGLNFAPDTVPVQDGPGGTHKGNNIRIKPAWWRYIRKLNPNDKDYARTLSVGAMWINIEWPQDDTNESWSQLARAEAVIIGGNFVLADGWTDTHLHIRAMSPYADTSVYDSARMNWYVTPWLFFKEVAINIRGKVINPGQGQDVYYPNLRGQSPDGTELPDRWIARSRVELFPPLPYAISSQTSIVEYYPQGCSVLGLTDKGQWVYLLKSTRPGERIFTTGWRLNTIGVIPPA